MKLLPFYLREVMYEEVGLHLTFTAMMWNNNAKEAHLCIFFTRMSVN